MMKFPLSLRSLIVGLFTSRGQRLRQHRSEQPVVSQRLGLERLEDRTVPSGANLASYGQLPLTFEANQGQAAAGVNFVAHGSGYNIALTSTGALLGLQNGDGQGGDVVALQLVGADPTAVVGRDASATRTNYLGGSDPSQWVTDVANFGRVEYRSVYRGIDLVYSGNQGQLEYSFVVAPGANPNLIRLAVQGAQGVAIDAHGNLVLHTNGGDVVEQAPVLYQQAGAGRMPVAGSFAIEGNGTIGFRVGAYNASRPLVIDPTLGYSSYLAGTGYAIAVDNAGEAFVTGAASTTFPTTAGAFQPTGSGVFVAKLNAAGTGLVYATYLGNGTPLGKNAATGVAGSGIAVDGAGNAYVTGLAGTTFPTTANAFQTTTTGTLTGFVTVLNPSGSGLLYSTYLSGVTGKSVNGSPGGAIAIDSAGKAYITGNANTQLATTGNAFQTTFPGLNTALTRPFVAEVNPNLSGSASLVYSSYLGSSDNNYQVATGVAVDGSGNAYVAGWTSCNNFPTTPGTFQPNYGGGQDVFVAKFNPSLFGSASLVYSTYLGKTGLNGYVGYDPNVLLGVAETGPAIAVDAAGDAYIAGSTWPGFNQAATFPTTAGAFQTTYLGSRGNAFVTKLNPTGSALVYSTYLGGNYMDGASSIAVDAAGNASVTGWTRSTNFPTMNPVQANKAAGNDGEGHPNTDTFVATLNATGSALLFSTYLGGTGDDEGFGIALDSAGNRYITGRTESSNFPTTAGALQTTPGSGFVSKITTAAAPSLGLTGFPTSTTAGSAGTFTLTALNPDGAVNTGYTGTVHFTSSDPRAVLPADYTFTAADQGVHTFSAALLTAGTQSLTATDTVTGGLTGSEAGITVNPGAVASLNVSAPASVTHGVAFNLVVTALDAYGNVVTNYTGNVTFSSSDSRATLPAAYTFASADAGVHTFTKKSTLRKTGTQTLTVTDPADGLNTTLSFQVI